MGHLISKKHITAVTKSVTCNLYVKPYSAVTSYANSPMPHNMELDVPGHGLKHPDGHDLQTPDDYNTHFAGNQLGITQDMLDDRNLSDSESDQGTECDTAPIAQLWIDTQWDHVMYVSWPDPTTPPPESDSLSK
ncbi:hypothetical protein FRB95_008877 [Tulasnella sp. JGI-2019a]|nr:hypothetical protein FRB95_008877 [Tulasnella sp. JGI-2019a]